MPKLLDTVAILTDTHTGVRSDSEVFAQHQREFYTDVFFPKCKALGIKKVLHLGDYFDRRKYINFKSLFWNKDMFLEPLTKAGMEMVMIVGNHDVAMKNTNQINSPELLFGPYSNVTVHTEPTHITIGATQIALVPWINSENYEFTMKFLKETTAKICAGHFEFDGFDMHPGQPCQGGMKTEAFNKFAHVWSGHFHHASKKGNIEYLGTSMEFTWLDYGDQKGFHIVEFYDDGSIKKSYVKNPNRMFYKYEYDDTKYAPTVKDIVGQDNIKDKLVKLVINAKKDVYKLDLFLAELAKLTPHELQVVDLVDISSTALSEDEKEVEAKETIVYLCEYVDGMKKVEPAMGNKVKNLFRDLYATALQGGEDA